MGVIYLRTNLVNGMRYVGQAEDFKTRERAWNCLKLRYANQLLTDERNKYGLKNFKSEILEECDNSKLDELERFWIKQLNTLYPNGYNNNEGGSIGFHHSEKTKEEISRKNSGEKNGMFGNTPWNKGVKGCFDEETLRKMSESNMGNTSALGHVVSEESKKLISARKKGVPNQKLSKQVDQIDMNTGEVVKTWESVAEAGRNGFKSVDRVCRGERPQAYNFYWKYNEKRLGNES